MEPYQDVNARTIDRWVEEGWEWGRPISHDVFVKAKQGEWQVVLTPRRPVPREWFGELDGKDVLGLASGGGQQMPVFAALGARCTVLDYSPRQLESERMVARREGYSISIVRADMTKPLPFPHSAFDLVFHPVSNCYVEEVEPIFKECFRVLKPGGILLCGLDTGLNFIVDDQEERVAFGLPFNPLRNPHHMKSLELSDGGIAFSHTLEEQVGGQLKAGFTLTHLLEDTNAQGRLQSMNIPGFIMTRALKP